jgi:hypothetical protein
MTKVYNTTATMVQLPLFASKKCNRCEQEKLLLDFPKNPDSRDGYKSICKVCNYATTKAYRKANPERHREQLQTSYYKNIEHRREYVQNNIGQRNEYYRNRYANDAEYRQHYREYQSNYCSTHRDQVNVWMRNWREKNPLKGTEYAMSYKARKEGVTVEDVDYMQILERDNGWCYICEQDILPHHDIEFDHVTPITRDGIHAACNIRVTHDICNSRKHTKLLEEMTPFQRRGPDN